MHNPGFYLYPIESSAENAEAIINLRYDDLRRAGLSAENAEEIANPDNESHVERQVKELDEYPRRYLGATAIKSGDLVAFSKTREWSNNDIKPFLRSERILGAIGLWLFKSLNWFTREPDVVEHPIYIEELVVAGDVSERKDIIDALVDRAIEIADFDEAYVAIYKDRNIIKSLQKNEFLQLPNPPDSPVGVKTLFIHPKEGYGA